MPVMPTVAQVGQVPQQAGAMWSHLSMNGNSLKSQSRIIGAKVTLHQRSQRFSRAIASSASRFVA